MNRGYHWFYRNYWWLLLVLFAVTVAAPMLFSAAGESPVLMIVVIANIALVYFVQKQRLTTLKISSGLLVHFNGRYAEMRPRLYRILEGESAESLSVDQTDDLYAYFDLCAEEYCFFSQDMIPPAAWEAWLGGMRVYYYNPRIRRLWDKALTRQSFYGFDSRLLK